MFSQNPELSPFPPASPFSLKNIPPLPPPPPPRAGINVAVYTGNWLIFVYIRPAQGALARGGPRNQQQYTQLPFNFALFFT
jgi:hypothetical protein